MIDLDDFIYDGCGDEQVGHGDVSTCGKEYVPGRRWYCSGCNKAIPIIKKLLLKIEGVK